MSNGDLPPGDGPLDPGAAAGGKAPGTTAQNNTYAAYVEAELKAERDRKSALDTRGGSLVTSSGAILAVLVGVGSLGRAVDKPIPDCADVLLVLALASFLAAAIAGILAQWNYQYELMSGAGLKTLLHDFWKESPGDSMRRVGAERLRAISSLRRLNGRKGNALQWGYGLQLAAIIFLAPYAFMMIRS